MKRDFFRKNIFTIGGVFVFTLILFVIINPFKFNKSSNMESLNKLKKENKHLEQDNVNLNKKLETEKSFYTDKINQLNQQLSVQSTTIGQKPEDQNLIENLQKGIKNELADSLGIFSPEYTKKGDKVAGLIVSDVRNESANGFASYHVDFTGEFKLKGLLINYGNGRYSFMVQENLEKIPHTFQAFEPGLVQISIINESELVKVDKIKNLDQGGSIEIECFFKNYSNNIVPSWGYSSTSSTAEFVKLVP